MKKIIYSLFVVLFAFSSCKEDAIDLFDTDNIYVQFVNEEEEFTFKSYPDSSEIWYPISLFVHGLALDEPREIVITADTSSTAIEGEHYVLGTYMVDAGTLNPVIYVHCKLSAEMDTTSFDLVLNIEDAPNAFRGEIYQTTISMNNYLEQPSWWVNDSSNAIYKNFLGTFSSKKYELFIIVTGEDDISEMSYTEAYTLVKQFQDYLDEQAAAGNTVYELDGTVMVTAL